MNLIKFIEELEAQNIKLFVDGERLRYRAPKEVLTPQRLSKIKQHKREIISLLQEQVDENTKTYPLSQGQRGLWLLYQLAPNSAAYNINYVARLRPDLDIQALQQAFDRLVQRHAILRTTYTTRDGEPIQQVHKTQKIHFKVTETNNWSQPDLTQWLAEEADRPFNLEQGPVFRIELLLGFSEPAAPILSLIIHHIVADFWSLEIIVNELDSIYQAISSKKPISLEPLKWDYKDYVRWETSMLAGPKGKQLWAYWQKQLSGELPVLNLPTARPRPPVQTYNGATSTFEFDEPIAQQIVELSRATGSTPYVFMLAVFQILLRRYTGQEDILIGTPMSGRHTTELQQIIGYFVNQVILRSQFQGNPTVEELLDIVRQQVVDALDHQEYPFGLLVEQLQPLRDPSRSPLSQVVFVWDKERDQETSSGKLGQLVTDVLATGQRGAAFDLSLTFFDRAGSLSGKWTYNTDLFEESMISRLTGHLKTLVAGALAHPQQRLSQLPLLTPAEQQQLIAWNQTQTDYPVSKTIVDLFQEQVDKTPSNLAVVFEGQSLTYHELNFKANQLAHYLIDKGLSAETLVGICVERSLEMVIGLLGILKAGGAYVPFDPDYPAPRLQFMLEDSQVPILLTQTHLIDRLPASQAKLIGLDREWATIAAYSGENPVVRLRSPENLAYVIYTSGSTGKPKGVMVEHHGISNLAHWQANQFEVTDASRITQFFSYNFDGAVGETMMALLNGAGLVILDSRYLSVERLIAAINHSHLNVIVLVPSLLKQLDPAQLESPASLKVISVGERCDVETAKIWSEYCQFFNAYGPTEYSVYSHCYPVSPPIPESIPIGSNIDNTKSYILDKHGNQLPIGVSGELAISGIGLARGYLNRPALNFDKFRPNRFDLADYCQELGEVLVPSALKEIEQFKQMVPIGNSTPRQSAESLSLLLEEQILPELDVDLADTTRDFLKTYAPNTETCQGFYRYLSESLHHSYASCGLNAEVLKILLDIEDFQGLTGVDFGCGSGEILQTLTHSGSVVAGIDINPLFIKQARQNGLQAIESEVDIDAELITDKWGEAFTNLDFVLSTLVLDRVSKPLNLLKNLFYVLRAGGRFALQTLLPVVPVEDGNISDQVIYTRKENCVSPGENQETDRWFILALLHELGADKISVHTLPYVVNSRDGLQEYVLWSFSGRKRTVPFQPRYSRLYHTGDLARRLPDGNLEYLGRLDHQVKLRGFRIELGEIEATLTQHDAVSEAVVVLIKDEGNPRLAAYLTLATPLDDDAAVLRTWLKARLPDYMIPAHVMVLEQLPLTPNGKIDRNALPAPELTATTKHYQAPRTDTEQRLVEVWQHVLKQTDIGIQDNFFERGGDSILSIQIVARVRVQGLSLSPQDLFQHQTIAELALVVQPEAYVKAEQGLVTGLVPLTPIQQAFFARKPAEPWHFNQALLLTVPADINLAALQLALAAILEHHDALRLRFQKTNEGWQQWYAPPESELPFHSEDLTALTVEQQSRLLTEHANVWQASFNLEQGPLVRLVLFQLGVEARLLWCIHHLVVDGVSWRILLEDLHTAYHQALADQPRRLPEKTSAFKTWAEQLEKWRKSDSFARDAEYWHSLPPATDLPVDNPLGRNRHRSAAQYTIHLSENTTQRLLTETPAAYRTQINDLLLTALMLTLRKWNGQTQHLIDLESHGRTDLFDELDLSRTVGWFTSLHTLSLTLPTNTDLGQALKAIKEQLRQVPHDGVGYGVLRYLCQESLPQGQIVFNYLGQFDQSLSDSTWHLAADDSGQAVSLQGEREHLIEINGQTVDGRLSLTWTYSDEQYQAETIQWLADHYQQQLQLVIEHCATHFGYTPSDFPLTSASQNQLEQMAQRYGHNLADIYPLSPMQQGMLFHTLYAPDSGIYFEQLHCGLLGSLNVTAFRQAWQALLDRHPIFRTAFWHQREQPLQLVYKQAPLHWQAFDWRELSAEQRTQELQNLITKERQQGFDLTKAPLMRVQLIRETDQQYRLVWHFHHLLMDGWSLPILLSELFEAYQAFCNHKTPSLPPSRPYRDYIHWLSQQDSDAAKSYWQEQLHGFEAPTPLMLGRRTATEQPADYQEQDMTLDTELTEQLERFSRQHRLTVNTLVQGAWACLLSRYSGETDVVFGVTTSGRQIPLWGIDRMLGLFINTLPLRVVVTSEDLIDWLQALQHRQQQNDQYAYTALVDIQSQSNVPGGVALFETLLVFENYPIDARLKDGTYKKPAESVSITEVQAIEYTNYPITLAVMPGPRLHFKLTYDSMRFSSTRIERMLAHLGRLLSGMVTRPNLALHQLPLLTEAEQEQLIAWNQTQTDYQVSKTIVDLFQEQVEKTPSNLAIVFEGQSLTYQALNSKANQLAHYLIEQGVQAETLVGICVERSIEMVIGLLGILKAGGAYVPLDPDYPAQRLQFMLEDSQVPVLLTQSHLIERLPLGAATVVSLDSEWATIAAYSAENKARQSRPENLAYVIYTSGSTGKPKGVMIEHAALTHFIHSAVKNYPISEEDSVLQFASINFDTAAEEIYPGLTQGGRLILRDKGMLDTEQTFLQTCQHKAVTILDLPTAYWQQLITAPDSQEHWPASVRLVIIGGEAASLQHVKYWQQTFSQQVQLLNTYGPTEATVVASSYRLTESVSHFPIGKPILGTHIYILDVHHNPTPICIPGELCIAGRGLARGYLNRPELTNEKFVEIEIFGKRQRIYKTGDLARWREDGNLEYLGRLDYQVKLRGFRIELGEIEATLTQHDAVSEAVVVLLKDEGNPRLVAYVTLATPLDDAAVLRTWLKARLPDYMLPASFTVLEKLPLTPNGKIDRNALPAPDLTQPDALKEPQSEVERLLSQIWSEVLGYEITNTQTDFFEAGGHSLLATQLVSRIRERFAVEMPLKTVFEHARLQEQAQWLAQQQRGISLPPLTQLAEDEPLVLSFAQQRLWFLAQLEGPSATYNMPAALRLSGEFSINALQQSFISLIEHHLNLRLCFPEVNGQATLQVLAVYNPYGLIDLSALPKAQQQGLANHLIDAWANAPFDLTTGPLMRVLLLKLSSQEHLLLFNMHHIISDGWSISVLVRQWSELYEAYLQNRAPQLPARSIQYPDYAAWQRNWLEGELLERQLSYWKEQLAGAPALLELPTDYPRPAVMTYQGAHLQTRLPAELTQRLKSFSQQNGVTLYMTLLTAFQILLSRYSGQPDISVGSPIANRTHRQTEDLIGFFVNTLVLRTQVNGAVPVTQLLFKVRQTALQAYAHQDIPFEYLVEQLNPARSLSHSPLFQVMLVLQNVPQEQLELSGLKISFEDTESTIAKFDLTLSLAEHEEVLVCDWEYRTDLFRFDTLKRMSEHFEILLEGLINQPTQTVGQLPLLTEAEQQQLIAWNQTQTDYPLVEKTIVDLFQEQVEQNPSNLAVVFEGQSLTYQELNSKANQLAHYLIEQGVQAETLVGICVERSLELVIGLLGILKAGGAYVPFDPDYPVPRLQFLLEDSQVPVLLTQSHFIERLSLGAAKLVGLDRDWATTIAAYSTSNPQKPNGAENLAYVIYTSGSTGKPKGVMIEHRSLTNLICWHHQEFAVNRLDKAALLASVAFDASTWELWPYLSCGACVCPVPAETVIASGSALLNWLNDQQITITFIPTPLLENLLKTERGFLTSLRRVLTGGDLLHSYLPSECDFKLYNNYGPTENTVVTTSGEVSPSARSRTPELPPIGQPIANTQIYLLDAHHNPTPIGIPGELCIAGKGLARGYLNRPELTFEKFIEVNLFGEPKRVYKTGDLARWRTDGNLEYLGRLDSQVKLRGFRIELGEIEATLTQHEAVTEAVVVLIKEDGNPRLAAYVTLATPTDDAAVLRTWLKAQLPDYMMPAHLMVLEQLPKTPNGKIDRNALPAPDLLQPEVLKEPQSEVERLLSQIWSEVLGYDITNTQTDFFEAGGHSLLATQLVSRIRERFSVDMPLKTVFEHARLQEQADWLAHQQRGTSLPPLTPLAEGEPLVLSFAQRRLWFLAQLEGPSATYNMPAALRLQGELSQDALLQTFLNLIEHHLNLRLCFPEVDGHATVQVLAVYNPLRLIDLSALSVEKQQRVANHLIAAFALAPFDLSTGPLMRVHLLKLSTQEHLLLFNMHHIITDGWSISVLVRQWSERYEAYLQNRALPLPARSIQYPDYAAWQRNWLEGELLERQLSYWKEQLAGAPALLELPTDYPRPAVMTYQGAHLQTRLPAELTQRLKSFSQLNGVTLYMTLLTAFQILLSRYSGQSDILVGSPIANRTHRSIEDLIGFFVNTLVLRTHVNGAVPVTQLLDQVRQTALQAYAHQDIPFEYLVEQLNPARSLSHSPLFQVMLVLQNVPGEQLELAGLKVSFEDSDSSTIAKFDLTLSLAEHEDVLVCDWEYRTDLFRPAFVKRMTEHFEVLLEGLINQPTQTVGQLPLLTSAEQQQLIAWNQTQTNYPVEKTIVDLFQEQVENTPSNLAVVFEGQSLTYQELNFKANQLAHYLIEQRVSAETLVGICVERSIEMVIGLLGILKAGGAYVPFDPDYPAPRLQFLLEDSQVPVLLTQSHLIERLPVSQAKLVDLERDWATIAAYSGSNPLPRPCPENLAYVIYTSGSTGKPKGVMIEHKNLCHSTWTRQTYYQNTNLKAFLLLSPVGFDSAVAGLFWSLTQGTKLVLPENALDLKNLTTQIWKHRISHLLCVPTLYSALLSQPETDKLTGLKTAIIAGESGSQNLLVQHHLKLPKTKLFNEYGPTEGTVWSSVSELKSSVLNAQCIGKPIANTQIYLLDAHHNPTPIGIPGELCLAGNGLARGYLNQPELTLDKFIEVELFGEPKRLYKTGDLARWREDGNLEYLGRRDHQVKLRGFRIELGEIEATLTQHETVREAVVVLIKDEGNPRLAAYVTLATPTDTASVLRAWLKARLPDYLMPAHIISLEQLPLTPNGKIDRNALPAPELVQPDVLKEPQSEIERLLSQIWSEVLGYDISNTNTDFFEAGGHSLLATQLVSRIRERFAIEMPLKTVFEHARLQEQADWLAHQQRGTRLPPLTPLAKGEPLVLSFAQLRLWFLAQLEGPSATYNMPAALRLHGELSQDALQQTFIALIEHHLNLRLCFPEVDGQATVQVLAVYNPLRLIDLSALPVEQQRVANHLIALEAKAPFDLTTGPLMRVLLLKLSPQEHLLLVNMHHIISDGWSISVLVRQWAERYEASLQNSALPLPARSIQYPDYAAWQRNWLEGELLERQLSYWKEQLAGAPALLELPTDYPRPAVMSYQGAHLQTRLPAELTQRLKSFSQLNGVTLYMTLLAAFQILLSRYSGQSDILVGSPIANRTHRQTEDIIGFFVNTLVLRTQLNWAVPVSQLLKQVRQTALQAYAHQDIPFEYLVEQLNPARSLSHSPLFQVMLVLQNVPQQQLELSGLKVSNKDFDSTIAKFDLTLSIAEHEQVLVCDWEYRTDLFRPATLNRMTEHFEVLLEGLINQPTQTVGQLPLLTEVEQQQLIAWNKTQTDYPLSKTIVDLFQEQVEKTPVNRAVVFEGQSLTYQELNTKANQLAHYLIEQGIQTETLVGICVERSLEMVIGLLGILKAGGAYVPLSPEYPAPRLQFLLEDSQVPVLLTQNHLIDRLPLGAAKLVDLDGEWATIATYSSYNPERQTGPTNLIYVIYTSGSTGKPKGAGVFHKGFTNLINWFVTDLKLTAEDSTLIISPFSFDLTQKNFFAPLILGGQLHLLPSAYYDPESITQLIADKTITWINCTPSAFYPLTEPNDDNTFLKLASLRYAVLGGEPISLPRLWSWLQAESCQAQLVNSYGPTECTDVCVAYLLEQPTLDQTIPIGRPISNVHLLILDDYRALLPVGVVGELYIGGESVGDGYLNDVEMTQSKFIPNPFNKDSRLYKTGDLVRYLPEGNIEYLGRRDHQVKLRGFRLELGEIEATLTQHEAVREAVVVLLKDNDNPRLAAYLTLATPRDDTASVLRTWLKARLPEYMLPASFTVLEKLPLTPNGKIDRNALPAPDLAQPNALKEPQSEVEHLLSQIWSEVLGYDITNTNTDFFEAGGHSLLATQLVSRIRERFAVEMPLKTVFEHARLQEQADWLAHQQRGTRLPPLTPLAEGEPLVLSFAQLRLWFLAQLEGPSATYNMPTALRLSGELSVQALQQTFVNLIEHHLNLRLCFPEVDGQATVQVLAVYNPLRLIDLSTLPLPQQQHVANHLIAASAMAPFDLSTGPLMRVLLLKLKAHEHLLLFNMHHIISDGWSISVLVRQWSEWYEASIQNLTLPLPARSIQYPDYAVWQRNWLQGELLERQLTYWKEQLAGAPALLELPTDYPRPAVMTYQGAQLQTCLTSELTQRLNSFSQQNGVTLYMALLAAFQILLSRYTGQPDILVGTPIANRTHRHTEDLIGFFVNTLVLRTPVNSKLPGTELLKEVRQTALQAYAHQDIPFEYVVEQLNPARSISHSPLFQVMLVLQNVPQEQLELSGLKISFEDTKSTIAQFDLTLSIAELEDVLVCDWEYRTDLFHFDTIKRMTEHFEVLLEGLINQPAQPVGQLPLLTEAEQQQLLAWNQTQTDYPLDKTIVDLFQEQVDKTPYNLAVVFEGQSLTYQALNLKANQLAHYLIEQGVQPETLVGICVERSIKMVIGLLGIMKAGGAYVPLDPDYPVPRLQFMLEDSQVPVLLTQTHLIERLPLSAAKLVSLDHDWATIAAYSSSNPVRRRSPENLAYVIYTSGSTGKPKGVMIEHRALANLLNDMQHRVRLTSNDQLLALTTLSFDIAALELYLPLLAGSQTIIISRETANNGETLVQKLVETQITLMQATPATWKLLLQSGWHQLTPLTILCGGEALPTQLGQTLLLNSQQLWNVYGPTETTIWSTTHNITQQQEQPGLIGRPISNTQIYILDAHHNPTPIGIQGELCIAGRGLARGYKGRPELTLEKFIEVEIFGEPTRIYKTGDLARWRSDGNLEYLGRLDYQIKLRGFRIELGEIEATLSQHEAVTEAVVVLIKDEGNPRLAAYVTLATPRDDTVSVLRTWLKARLPEYMLPASFTVLDKLPLTPNGKIDRNALPAPEAWTKGKHYLAPRDTVELQLAQIWEQVLERRPIGILENFFELGGHSLLAVRLMSQIHHAFDKQLPIATLFQGATIVELAQLIRHHEAPTTWPTLIPIQPQGSRPPLFCFPGAGGNVLYLHSLAVHLDKDQPCYGLQPPGLDGKSRTPSSIEALAAHHKKELIKVQPQGPYFLAGHSFGGQVAFELARQLEQQGETVALLTILDTSAPSADQEDMTATWDEIDWLWTMVEVFEELSEAKLDLKKETVQSQTTLAQSYELVMQHLKQGLFFAPTAESNQLKAIVDIYKANTHAQTHYQPQGPIKAPIVLFRAEEQFGDTPSVHSEDLDWSQYTEGEVIVKWVPGTHLTMLNAPHVKTLAAQLQTQLLLSTRTIDDR